MCAGGDEVEVLIGVPMRTMKTTLLPLLSALFCLSCCYEHHDSSDVGAYTCSPEQQARVREMTKVCKEKLIFGDALERCFESSVKTICTMKPPRCPVAEE